MFVVQIGHRAAFLKMKIQAIQTYFGKRYVTTRKFPLWQCPTVQHWALKTSEDLLIQTIESFCFNPWFSGVFQGYKMGTLARNGSDQTRNGLIQDKGKIKYLTTTHNILITKLAGIIK